MAVVQLDDEAMTFFRNRNADDPAVIKDRLLKDYAERTGGVTLEFWKLSLARIWDEPFMMTNDEVAARLGLSREGVEKIEEDTAEGCGLT